jgi:hypothetical protein
VKAPTRGERIVLARAATRLMNEWQLTPANQLRLLGLSVHSTRSLVGYRRGGPLPPQRDTLDRVAHLVGIYRSLRVLYPKNPELRERWFTSANKQFGNRSPLVIAVTGGISGLTAIRSVLAMDTDEATGMIRTPLVRTSNRSR